MAPPRSVTCPSCGENVPWTPQARWRPFCSARCKTMDLGAWASESYRIPAVERDDDESGPRGPDAPTSNT